MGIPSFCSTGKARAMALRLALGNSFCVKAPFREAFTQKES
jgi:hypothetical protein